MSKELFKALGEIVLTSRTVRHYQDLVSHYEQFNDTDTQSYADAQEGLAKYTEPFKAACEKFIAEYRRIYNEEK